MSVCVVVSVTRTAVAEIVKQILMSYMYAMIMCVFVNVCILIIMNKIIGNKNKI